MIIKSDKHFGIDQQNPERESKGGWGTLDKKFKDCFYEEEKFDLTAKG